MIRSVCAFSIYLLFVITGLVPVNAAAQTEKYTKVLFANSPMPGSFFYSETNYRSSSWIQNSRGKLPVTDSVFFTPGNALQLTYISAAKGDWKAKILSHDIRGMDSFITATHLSFRLFISNDTKLAELPSVTLENKDSTTAKPLSLQHYILHFEAHHWLSISIPLTDFNIAITPNNINAFILAQQSADGRQHSLYIDQVELTNNDAKRITITPILQSATGYEKHVDIVWKPITDTSVRYIKIYRSNNGKTFYPVGIQSPWINRYTPTPPAKHSLTKSVCSIMITMKRDYQIWQAQPLTP